jgi:hypothetical protein
MRTGINEPKALGLPVKRVRAEYVHRRTGAKVRALRLTEPSIFVVPDHKDGGHGGTIQFRDLAGGYVMTVDGVNYVGVGVHAFEEDYATPKELAAEKAAAAAGPAEGEEAVETSFPTGNAGTVTTSPGSPPTTTP